MLPGHCDIFAVHMYHILHRMGTAGGKFRGRSCTLNDNKSDAYDPSSSLTFVPDSLIAVVINLLRKHWVIIIN